MILAASTLLLVVRLGNRSTNLRSIWHPLVVLGAVNAALSFMLIAGMGLVTGVQFPTRDSRRIKVVFRYDRLSPPGWVS